MKSESRKYKPLTEAEIKEYKPKEKPYKMGDGGGLYIMVYPNGSKLWGMRYLVDGKDRRTSFGAWPRVSIREARQRRDEIKRMVRDGLDPALQKKEAKAAAAEEVRQQSSTFKAIALQWYEKKSQSWSEGHKKAIRLRLEKYLFPELGDRLISELDIPDYLALLQKIEARGTIETAHRVQQYCSQICQFARISGLIKYNPVSELKGVLTTVKTEHHASIIDPKELGALLRDIDDYRGTPEVAYALKIMPYVFTRSGELRGAEWREIDFDKAEWSIPAGRMKMKRPHLVPLARQVLALLKELYSITGNGALLFPSALSATRCISDMGLLNALRRMGYARGKMTIHGFRATASTLLNAQGFRWDVVEAQLAHAERNAIRAAYNHADYMEERRDMMQKWADYLDSLRDSVS